MTVWRVSCIFQSCASSPNNAKSREAQVPVKQECGLWWKDSSPWEDWLVTWQVCRITTIIINIRNINIYKINFIYIILIILYEESHMQSLFGIWSQVLCRTFSNESKNTLRWAGHLHFHKRYNVVLSTRITLCTIAVDTKSFPAPVSNVSCSRTFR